MSALRLFLVTGFFFLAASASASAAEPSEREPSESAKGKVYEWTSEKLVRFQYIIPRDYDAKVGAPLTVILHGSNLDRRWGFANHKPGEFRPKDIVISPDGTTSNGNGAFNFLGTATDAAKFRGLLEELRTKLNITAVYLYGHSQGSFFALYYAGEAPTVIKGVVAHASGVWTQTRISPDGHGQAIVLMHGTADPVVPYGQSVGGFEVYRSKGYPMVRLRALEGWSHWPAENNGSIPHVSQQLAWVEGMTSNDPARLGPAFGVLTKPRDATQHDFAALYQVAKRLSTLDALPPKAREVAGLSMAKVETLAEQQISAMKLPMPDSIGALDGSPWIGQLPMFLRAFNGVPAADQLAKDWSTVLSAQDKASVDIFTEYHAAMDGTDPKAAFGVGVRAMREAFLSRRATDPLFLQNMAKWADDRNIKIDRETRKNYQQLANALKDSLEKGRDAFEAINKRASL